MNKLYAQDDRLPDISVVVPVYKCGPCLKELHARLTATLRQLGVTYELLFVDDRSPDDSWSLLTDLASRDRHVKIIRLSRNFGQHVAITAGLSQCSGHWVVVMDGDLEDPPEELVRLYETALSGYDIVYARRRTRKHSLLRRLLSKLYFHGLNLIARINVTSEHGTLSIISRKVVDAYLQVRDIDRHYLLILYWLGFDSTEIEYDRAHRRSGKSAYTLGALLAHATNGLFFQTTILLRWIVYVGFAISASGGMSAAVYTYRYLASRQFPPGWTTLVVLQLLLGGFIIASTGVTALYIGKVFQQVKGRPLFVVSDFAGERQLDSSLAGPVRTFPEPELQVLPEHAMDLAR